MSRATSAVRAFLRAQAWVVAIWAAMALWAVVLYGITRDRYLGFREGRFDLGNMVQAVWSTANGRPLEVTHGSTGEQMLRLGGHVDPFLALLAPLWGLWPSPLSLALAQIVVVSLGALPIFWLGRRHLGSERLAGILALGYLAYPWVATSAAGAIHPVTFAITFLLYCVWFLETGRIWPFAVFAALTMSTGELMGLPVAGLGVWYAFARDRRRAGALITAAGFAWTFIAVYLIVPAVRGSESMFFGFYDRVGGSPEGVLRSLVTDPGTVVSALFEPADLAYVLWLGVPLLFLFLLSPGLSAIAVPQLLANGLSDFASMTDPRYHSVAAVVPFLVAATVLGMSHVPEKRRPLAAVAVVTCSAILSAAVAPWPRALGLVPLGGSPAYESERVAALGDAVALVPADARVAASNGPGGHLSARRYVYSIPNVQQADWVLIDASDPWIVTKDSPILTRHPEVVSRLVRELSRDPTWSRAFARDGVFLFRRTSG